MAQYMIADAAAKAGLDVSVDSAGTTSWEVGNPIDSRARKELGKHGIDASSHRARSFDPAWFDERDLILALDIDHYDALWAMAPSPEAAGKIRMLRSFDPLLATEIPERQGIYDPWYGNQDDFTASWDMIQAAIPGILEHIRG